MHRSPVSRCPSFQHRAGYALVKAVGCQWGLTHLAAVRTLSEHHVEALPAGGEHSQPLKKRRRRTEHFLLHRYTGMFQIIQHRKLLKWLSCGTLKCLPPALKRDDMLGLTGYRGPGPALVLIHHSRCLEKQQNLF